MSIFGDRKGQGSFEDARRQSFSQDYGKLQLCLTCKRGILPFNSLHGIGYRCEDFCQCMKVQTPKAMP